ncbi:hypothetical protein BJ322DRAFT_1004418 [Thelephora terrestris]|uniref:CHCH domain-containing protein n=1 Tax=Thelephora terrestris TaxID=56493 RepID=A0A9P6L7H5_9AGAM|nr:hypothetical protein BJ322DRAFT_1004418 [Thelephora terrestris]
MSFGRPPSLSSSGFTATPPDRGSFPLDHYGECKGYMIRYLECLKTNGSTSTPCRVLSKDYLDCRMNRGLMERDDWKNLGMGNLDASQNASATNTEDTGQSNER